MNKYGLVNGLIVTDGEVIRDKAVIVDGPKIESVTDKNALPRDVEQIDLQGNYLSPGFIDVQVNGAGGALWGGAATPDGLAIMERALLQSGTTGFLATAATNTIAYYKQIISYAVDYRSQALGNCLGLHIEGPYINPLSRGAHPTSLIKKATLSEVKELVESAHGEIKVITMAPELQSEEVIDYLDSQGIVVSIGHSAASYEEAMHFLEGRQRMATHLYNGMQPMHHRRPGLIPAIFRAHPFTGIVADGIHVSYPMVRLAKQVLGEQLMLVTDAVTACQTGTYHHILRGDHYVTIGKDGKETISGSALTMMKAVQNCVEHVGIALPEAVNMATLYPARSLSIDNHLGLIREDYAANMVVFDKNYQVKEVYLKGDRMMN